MRYMISRTSSRNYDGRPSRRNYDGRPCADAVAHESDYSWLLDDDFDKHGRYWTLDAKDIDELYERFGRLVVQSPSRHWQDPDAPKIEVEIYDDWRE